MINSQLLLFLNIGFGIFLVLYFILGRPKPKQPTRLNMRAKGSAANGPMVLEPEGKNELQVVQEDQAKEARSLAIRFVYNSHDFEAHNVLGVPQGASMHMVTQVYQNLVRTSDVRSLQLYESAYSAIAENHRKHRL